jgi:hypothetical protein
MSTMGGYPVVCYVSQSTFDEFLEELWAAEWRRFAGPFAAQVVTTPQGPLALDGGGRLDQPRVKLVDRADGAVKLHLAGVIRLGARLGGEPPSFVLISIVASFDVPIRIVDRDVIPHFLPGHLDLAGCSLAADALRFWRNATVPRQVELAVRQPDRG